MNLSSRLTVQIAAIGASLLVTATGLIVVDRGSWAFLLVGSFLVAALASYLSSPLPRLFDVALVALLGGYSLFGRGFAYLGIPPLFVGEFVLALGITSLVVAPPPLRTFRTPLILLLLLFMLWGSVRTFPFVGQYGLDALRDGVVWAYATFAVLILAFIRSWTQLIALLRWFAHAIPLWLLWFPAFGVTYLLARDSIPSVPGTTVPVLGLKFGDMGVHLAGVAALLALRLHAKVAQGATVPRLLSRFETLAWGLWIVGFLIASSNRGALVSMLVSLAVVFLLRPISSGWLRAAAVAVTLSPLAFVVSIRPDAPPLALGVLQRVESVIAIATGREQEAIRAETARWRLNWWSDILGYTVFGEYRWGGKGYGINLANADGYQVLSDGSLRSPHNGHLTILARSGVPGAALWLALQGGFAIGLLTTQHRLRQRGEGVRADVGVWILAYWTAFMANASFDVFLEGPQGGIWFWVIFGLGLAWMRLAPVGKVDS
jgi:hypothetical protein